LKRNAVTRSEEETEAFGESLAADLAPGDVVYLVGDLGAGKTCLARGVARGLGAVAREVASPTFAILHEYAGADGTIRLRHLDLYRLKDRSEELQILGLPESVAGAPIVVEWPGQAVRRLLPPNIELAIETLPDGNRRITRD
jgi:tRNA threonylcarbamoyladenosine biosynthesis protein TsaE